MKSINWKRGVLVTSLVAGLACLSSFTVRRDDNQAGEWRSGPAIETSRPRPPYGPKGPRGPKKIEAGRNASDTITELATIPHGFIHLLT